MNKGNKSPKKIKPVGADGHRGRMFNKLISTEGEGISLRDTVEMLLFFPIRVSDTRDIAVELMARFENNLEQMLTAKKEELCKISGIGPSVASFLGLVGDISQTLNDKPLPLSESLPTQERISEIFSDMRSDMRGDELWAILIDGNSFISEIFKVTREFCLPSERELYSLMQTAVRSRSVGIIFAHIPANMEVYPTAADIECLNLMKSALSVTNLTLLDYYIIGGDEILKVTGLDDSFK